MVIYTVLQSMWQRLERCGDSQVMAIALATLLIATTSIAIVA